jgi:hypothetical protein
MTHWLANLIYRYPVLTKAARQPYKLFRPGTPLPILLGEGRGFRFCYWKNAAYVCGFYEYPLQRTLAQVLTPGMVFYDIGASEGFFTVVAARLVGDTGQVVALEPHPYLCTLHQA